MINNISQPLEVVVEAQINGSHEKGQDSLAKFQIPLLETTITSEILSTADVEEVIYSILSDINIMKK